ncbi:hypothetical protein ABTD85_21155, partial [Acinetobacter baumannii]
MLPIDLPDSDSFFENEMESDAEQAACVRSPAWLLYQNESLSKRVAIKTSRCVLGDASHHGVVVAGASSDLRRHCL